MGLDISYYSNAKKLDCVFNASGDPIDPVTREPLDGDWTLANINSDFPGRADELEDGAVYASDRAGGFCAGGYGRYNAWRNELARIAGYPETRYERYGRDELRFDAGAWEAEGGPFWELINFSDCEGMIGAAVSAKLAADFAAFQLKADEGDEFFRKKYAEWRKAFETAANSGFVDFH